MDNISEFRQKIQNNLELISSIIDEMSHKELSRLIHDLWQRQIELEVQNEEAQKLCTELETSHHSYEELYRFAPFAYCIFDKDGFIREANPRLAELLGYDSADFLNTRFSRYLPEEEQNAFFQHLHNSFERSEAQSCELNILHHNGSLKAVLLESIAVQNDERSAFQCRTAILDISFYKQRQGNLQRSHRQLQTEIEAHRARLKQASQQLEEESAERKRVGDALRISERQYRFLAENVSDGIAIFQGKRMLFSNQAFKHILGIQRTSREWRFSERLVRHDDKARFMQHFTIPGNSLPSLSFQLPCFTEGGREIWLEGDLSTIEWEGQAATLMSARDITARKRRESADEQEKQRLEKEIRTLKSSLKDRYRFGELVGKSEEMQQIYEQIMRASQSEANVFILGESGTGKELVARTIHNMSKRRTQRFVPVNCGAVPESLFESEFFGHRKGAFTGAFRDKQGFFSVAHTGTLFLDELGELTPAMQVKLLRVLDDGEYIPLGDTHIKKVDVRIIAATNRDLDDLRKRELLREDFFFRLHVFAITVPPLRQRKDDIPLLLDHFLAQYSGGEQQAEIPGATLEAFYAYDWPGNVREFQNALQRWLSGQPLNFLAPEQSRHAQQSQSKTETVSTTQEYHEVMEEFEKKLILEMLEQTRWNKSKTASLLGIPRRSLYRKMQKYGIA